MSKRNNKSEQSHCHQNSFLNKFLSFVHGDGDTNKEQLIMNVVLLGGNSVGKSTFISKLTKSSSQLCEQEIKISEKKKTVQFQNRTVVCRTWDTIGNIKYNDVIGSFIDSCDFPKVCIVFYDVTRVETFHLVQDYIRIWRNNQIPSAFEQSVVVLGNKVDQQIYGLRQVSTQQGIKLAEKNQAFYLQMSNEGNFVETYFTDIVLFKLNQMGLVSERGGYQKQRMIQILKYLNCEPSISQQMNIQMKQTSNSLVKQIMKLMDFVKHKQMEQISQTCLQMLIISESIDNLSKSIHSLSLFIHSRSNLQKQFQFLDEINSETVKQILQKQKCSLSEKQKQFQVHKQKLSSYKLTQCIESLEEQYKKIESSVKKFQSSKEEEIYLKRTHFSESVQSESYIDKNELQLIQESMKIKNEIYQTLTDILDKFTVFLNGMKYFEKRISFFAIYVEKKISKAKTKCPNYEHFQFLLDSFLSNEKPKRKQSCDKKYQQIENFQKNQIFSTSNIFVDTCQQNLRKLVNINKSLPQSKQELERQLKIIGNNDQIMYSSWKSQQKYFLAPNYSSKNLKK